MNKKLVFVLIVVVLLAQFTTAPVFAANNCPPGFTLEPAMPHEDHHHQHVGNSTDKNGDGYICVKHITPDEDIHVHTDNHYPK